MTEKLLEKIMMSSFGLSDKRVSSATCIENYSCCTQGVAFQWQKTPDAHTAQCGKIFIIHVIANYKQQVGNKTSDVYIAFKCIVKLQYKGYYTMQWLYT